MHVMNMPSENEPILSLLLENGSKEFDEDDIYSIQR
jgi:hypothetical protein